MLAKILLSAFALCALSLEVQAHTNVYVGVGGWHHGGYWHDRVYYADPWYHPDHVYVYNGDPYATYYAGNPYYVYDPRFYYYP